MTRLIFSAFNSYKSNDSCRKNINLFATITNQLLLSTESVISHKLSDFLVYIGYSFMILFLRRYTRLCMVIYNSLYRWV